MNYKVNVLNKTEWNMLDATTLTNVNLKINPFEKKMFNHDIFTLQNDTVQITHSIIRNISTIQGVLMLDGNKTFGKISKNKYYYRCRPDDVRLPEFLIPHKIRIEFNKKLFNKYIVFKFKNWENKHPIGTIVQILGPVNNLNSFYEYQLYCKSLYSSIQQFTSAAKKKLRLKSSEFFINDIKAKYKLDDRLKWNIFSIDPSGSKDFDDAFSIKKQENIILLSIYISNVTLWLESLNLWDSFSNRIATIYLPDRKRPMLPTILSDALCSLMEKNTRFAFTLDIKIKDGLIIDHSFKNTLITVNKNFVYDSSELKKNKDYIYLFKIITELNKKQNYMVNIKDSHDIVAYIMVLMNCLSGKHLEKEKCGIFRSIKLSKKQELPKDLPPNVSKFIQGWNSSGGQYVTYGEYHNHDLLNINSYVHITSPIRRLVDLLNMLILQDNLGLFPFNETTKRFYNKWLVRLPYINTTMRSIRKIQNDCALLNKCIEEKNPKYEGYIFDRIERNDGLYQYIVFLPTIKMINRLVCRDLYQNFSKHLFKIYIFMDEIRLKQKVRIEILIS